MKYALLVYTDQSSWEGLDEEEAAQPTRRVDAALARALRGDGKGRSRTSSDASSRRRPRRRSSASSPARRVVTDGPFAETKEQIGGLFLTTLPDLDEAIRIASLAPAAEYGSMEVRPIVER